MGVDSPSNVYITSTITGDEYAKIVDQVNKTINHSARAPELVISESDAQLMLKPLAEDGALIRNQLISKQVDLSLTTQEVVQLKSLTDDQLAELSFTIASIYNNDPAAKDGITWDDFIDCLGEASGVNDIKDIIKGGLEINGVSQYVKGTKALISAKTTKQILAAVSRRSYGWVSVFLLIYDFSDCISTKIKKE